MRILIPYVGTKNAENALLKLENNEFGKDVEIMIVITDIFMAESPDEISETRCKRRLDFESSGTCSYISSRWKLEEERFLVNKIQSRLSADFPSLNIKVETLPGYSLVSSELLEKAGRWKADLIILGKQKHLVGADKESLNGKQISKNLSVSNQVGGMKKQEAKGSVQTISANELFTEVPKQALRRLVKSQRKVNNFASVAAVSV